MRHLRVVSLLFVIVGVAAFAAAGVLGFGSVWALAGLLLVWAGVVKLVVVAIWRRVVDAEPESTLPSRR